MNRISKDCYNFSGNYNNLLRKSNRADLIGQPLYILQLFIIFKLYYYKLSTQTIFSFVELILSKNIFSVLFLSRVTLFSRIFKIRLYPVKFEKKLSPGYISAQEIRILKSTQSLYISKVIPPLHFFHQDYLDYPYQPT